MFAVHCHIHESEVLLDWSRVEGLRHTDDGPVIDWHCWCGGRGSLIAGVRSEPRDLDAVVVDLAERDAPSSPRPGSPSRADLAG